jgi:hypothetical protein
MINYLEMQNLNLKNLLTSFWKVGCLNSQEGDFLFIAVIIFTNDL